MLIKVFCKLKDHSNMRANSVLCHTRGSENLGVEAQVPIIIRKTDDDCHCFLKSVTWSPSGMLSCDGM